MAINYIHYIQQYCLVCHVIDNAINITPISLSCFSSNTSRKIVIEGREKESKNKVNSSKYVNGCQKVPIFENDKVNPNFGERVWFSSPNIRYLLARYAVLPHHMNGLHLSAHLQKNIPVEYYPLQLQEQMNEDLPSYHELE